MENDISVKLDKLETQNCIAYEVDIDDQENDLDMFLRMSERIQNPRKKV